MNRGKLSLEERKTNTENLLNDRKRLLKRANNMETHFTIMFGLK